MVELKVTQVCHVRSRAVKTIDLTGERFGRLTVIGKSDIQDGKGLLWDCSCSCGNVVSVRSYNLRIGKTRSCGCLKRTDPNYKTHGKSRTRIYGVWTNMKTRCCNPNSKAYPRYGGRGIKVCDEWTNPSEFIKWANESGYNDGLTLDRIDNDGDYCPSNCRWVSMKVQGNNTSRNRLFTMNGETQTLAEWCEKTGMPYKTVYKRVFILGWDFEKAMNAPIDEKKRNTLAGIKKEAKVG